MIDTDKYEGHTEGPWEVRTHYDTTCVCYSKDDDSECSFVKIHEEHENEEDAQLIADAPLLLAEVERLRKVMSKIGCSLCDECGLSIEEHIRYHTENDVIAGCPFGED